MEDGRWKIEEVINSDGYKYSKNRINIIKTMNKKELETRLVSFTSIVLKEVQKLKKDPVRTHLSGQIIRSSTAVALNYGEAQGAESKRDFIHKTGIVLKELRETQINLSLIAALEEPEANLNWIALIKENDELIAIFYKTIQTARANAGLELT
jgi:four helix bundle protein